MSTKPARRGHPLIRDGGTEYRAIRDQVAEGLPGLTVRDGERAEVDARPAGETAPGTPPTAPDGEAAA